MDNKWIDTATYVSEHGSREIKRNDPFAFSATFTLSQNGYDYKVDAHSSPYSKHGETFTLTIKKGKNVVCRYSYPEEKATISKGDEWILK